MSSEGVGLWWTNTLRGSGLEGFEFTVGAGPYTTAENDWNVYNIPTWYFFVATEVSDP